MALRESGKVNHFGVSNFTPSQFELLSSRLSFPLITNEIRLSVMHLDSYHDGTLDLCQQRRISPMAWAPLGSGRLFDESTEQALRLRGALDSIGRDIKASMDQVALAWILKHPTRMVPIVGIGKTERVKSAVQAESLNLTREQWFRIWVASMGERLALWAHGTASVCPAGICRTPRGGTRWCRVRGHVARWQTSANDGIGSAREGHSRRESSGLRPAAGRWFFCWHTARDEGCPAQLRLGPVRRLARPCAVGGPSLMLNISDP